MRIPRPSLDAEIRRRERAARKAAEGTAKRIARYYGIDWRTVLAEREAAKAGGPIPDDGCWSWEKLTPIPKS